MIWIYICSLFLEIVVDLFLIVFLRYIVLFIKYILVYKLLIRIKGNIYVYVCYCWFKIYVI